MMQIEVVAAVIHQNRKVFAAQRGYGEFKDRWEFPGGKIEPGESKKEAVVREIKEELDITIHICKKLGVIKYDYPSFRLIMHCYLGTVKNGSIKLLEHENARWLELEDIETVDWLPADMELLPAVVSELRG